MEETETETAVEVDRSGAAPSPAAADSVRRTRPGWRSGIIRTLFHVSPYNKMAIKMYSTKRKFQRAREDQDRNACMRWMIHPCSNFK